MDAPAGIRAKSAARRVRARLARLARAVAACAVLASAHPPPAAAANVFIQVLSPAVTLTPTPADYVRDYVEITGTSGIQLRIKTNDPVGMQILVRCPDPAPQIALDDFLVRASTPAGEGGSALSSYTPIQATNMFLWSTGAELAPFYIVYADIRIRNLVGYSDSPGGGTSGYTNTLVFTVVAQ